MLSLQGNQANTMKQTEVAGIVIDICSRSFLLISDEGDAKHIQADTPDEFIAILAAIDNKMPEEQIEYAELALTTD
jgi:hypothetical protein